MGVVRVVWWLLLLGCGRVGFSPAGDGGAGPTVDSVITGDAVPVGEVSITVLAPDELASAGQPLANVAVLVNDSASQRMFTTNSAGNVVVPVTGSVSVHVVYSPSQLGATSPSWRVYSIFDVGGGTAITLGGHAGTTTVSAMVDMPSRTATPNYVLLGPSACEISGIGGNQLSVTVQNSCTDEAIEAYAGAYNGSGALVAWISAPSLVLSSSATAAITGTWTNTLNYTLSLSGIPANASGVSAELGDVTTSGDFLAINGSDAAAGGTVVVPGTMSAGGVAIVANSMSSVVATYRRTSVSSRFLPMTLNPGAYNVNAALLPFVTSIATDATERTIAWGGDGIGSAQLVAAYETISWGSTSLVWTAYAPPTTTTLGFPSLPASFAAAVPATSATWGWPALSLIEIVGSNAATMLGSIDLEWRGWTGGYGPSLPPAGLATSTYEQELVGGAG
jgi:hypothetical protein